MRFHLGLNERTHYSILSEISEENPELLYKTQYKAKSSPTNQLSSENSENSSEADQPTIIRRKRH
ncbi:MAG: hypothetical protein AAFV71_16920 [Cyanobacteria bacterium J06633_8]